MESWLVILVCCVAASLALPDGCENCGPDYDFKKKAATMWAVPNFNQEGSLGGWYKTRWYLSMSETVSDELFDRADYAYVKDDRLHFRIYGREKTNNYCDDPVDVPLTNIYNGVYEAEDPNGETIRSAVVYFRDDFLVDVFCHGPSKDGCRDVSANFWTRTKTLSKEHMEIGVKALKKVCYPYMNRFIDIKQRIDCMPAKDECDDDQKDGKKKGKKNKMD